jgi:hypothetical protein
MVAPLVQREAMAGLDPQYVQRFVKARLLSKTSKAPAFFV